MGERREAADVIGVQVGDHDPPHRERVELGGDLVLRRELEARQPEVRVPARVIAGA